MKKKFKGQCAERWSLQAHQPIRVAMAQGVSFKRNHPFCPVPKTRLSLGHKPTVLHHGNKSEFIGKGTEWAEASIWHGGLS
jgi:hypothetical protein